MPAVWAVPAPLSSACAWAMRPVSGSGPDHIAASVPPGTRTRPTSSSVGTVSIQCHDDDASTASTLASGSGIASPRPATRPHAGDRLGQHRPHAVVGLHGHDLVGPPDQQPGQCARTGTQVDDRVHRLWEDPLHRRHRRPLSVALVLRGGGAEAGGTRGLLFRGQGGPARARAWCDPTSGPSRSPGMGGSSTSRRVSRSPVRSRRSGTTRQHERFGHGKQVVRDGGGGPAARQEAPAQVGLRRVGRRLRAGPHARGQHHRLLRAGLRAARGRPGPQPGPGHQGHGPGDLLSRPHLAHRGPGRPPRRRGRHGGRGRRPRYRHGPQLVRQHAGRGRRRGQPADLLPDLLDRHAGPDRGAGRAGPGRRGGRPHRHLGLVLLARARLGQPHHPRDGGPAGHGALRPRGPGPPTLVVVLRPHGEDGPT